MQRMLIDAPGIEDGDEAGNGGGIALTDDNADKVLEMINKMNR